MDFGIQRIWPATACRSVFLVCELWLLAASCVVFNAKFALVCDTKLSCWPFDGVAVDRFSDWWLALAIVLLVVTTCLTIGVDQSLPWFSRRPSPLVPPPRRRIPHYLVYRWWLVVSLMVLRSLMAVQLVAGCAYALIVIYTTIAIPLRLIEYSIVS